MTFPRSLRFRLLMLVFMAVLPLLALILYDTLEQRRAAARDAREDSLRMVRLIAANQERIVEETNQLLIALSQLPEVKLGDSEQCSGLFSRLLKQYPLYANLGANRLNGDLFCSGTPLTRPVNSGEMVWFQHAVRAEEFSIGDYQASIITGKPVLIFGYPVKNSGRVRSVIHAAVDLDWLRRFLASAKAPEGTILMLVDVNGMVLARYPEPEKWASRSGLDLPVVRTVMGQKGEGTAEGYGLDGNIRIFAFTTILGTQDNKDVFLMVGMPRDIVFEKANRIFVRNFILLGVVALLTVVVTLKGSEIIILRTVDALVTATRRLSSGDLRARTGLDYRQGELGQLAAAFDEMADGLQKRDSEISASLREKEVLLKEIHHRVKNNLQITASLLSLQMKYIRDPQMADIFRESRERIKSMALIHEKLYRTKDLSRIDFSEYITSLADNLYRTYGADPGRIRLGVSADRAFLNIETAVPCGLILNELFSNCLKHAFPGAAKGEILIRMLQDTLGTCILSVSDNGAGFPEGLDYRNTSTLGLQLVNTLVRQLNGTIGLSRGHGADGRGTELKITFNELQYKQKD